MCFEVSGRNPKKYSKSVRQRRRSSSHCEPTNSSSLRVQICGFACVSTLVLLLPSAVLSFGDPRLACSPPVARVERLDMVGINVAGAGRARMENRILVPAHSASNTGRLLQHRSKSEQKAISDSLPPGIDLLLGTKLQHKMKMKVEQGNVRLEIRNLPSKNSWSSHRPGTGLQD